MFRDLNRDIALWRGLWLGSDPESQRGLEWRLTSGPPLTVPFRRRGHGD